jgi:hypothetical protein
VSESIAHTTRSSVPAPGPEAPARAIAGGRYRIGRFLGRGASKQVFLAEDTALGREVAISFVGRVASDAAQLRYQREVRAMARLGDHPNVVSIHDVGTEDGTTYIVAQYVRGGSLADLMRTLPRRRMGVARALAVARDVAAALAHAHALGVVHRDVKPGNVLLGEGDAALLTDFGVAHTLADLRLTGEHLHVGTVPYMPPEQARGAAPDPRSDLYALGAMLFELLCGELPFPGSDAAAILAQHAGAPRPSVAVRNPAIAPPLDALVAQLMAIDPAGRPPSAAALLERLDALSPDGPAPVPPRPVRPLAEAVRLPPALAGGRQAAFVGRTGALGELRDTWRRALAGEPGVVLVRGNAGIGKTRLCTQFAREVHAEGGTVLYGRCEEEALAPYGPFVEALRQFAVHQPDLPQQLDLPAGFALARLGWPVPGAASQAPPEPRSDRAAGRYQLFETAVMLVAAMAAHAPLLVIFDDVHWADVPTLRLLRHLVRFVGTGPVMLVCTLRDDEPEHDERRSRALEEIRREPIARTLDLEGLSETETAELVVACGQAPAAGDVVSRLRERTAGNPFYIEETLHGVRDLAELRDEDPASGLVLQAVPSGIEALIRRRLARLDPPTRAVLGAAAVAGREFGVELLAALGDWDAPAVSDALQEAIRDGIVVEVPGRMDRFAFRHALVRMTLYADQAPSRRMALHARCGEALEAGDARAAELAHHFYAARHAGYAERALRHSLAAAQWASDALAFEEAVAHRDRALELLASAGPERDGERCDVLLSRGRALWRSGEAAEAQRTYLGAAELARALGDPDRFASAALGYGRRHYDPGETQPQLVALLEEALERLGPADRGPRARVLAGLADALHFREPPERVQAYSREAVAMARRLGDDDALAVALAGLHGALLHTAYLEERLPIGLELLALVGDGRPGEHGATALHWRLYDLFEAGDIATARREHARLVELAERLGQPLYRHFAAAWEAKWLQTAGRFAEAEEQARRSLDFARRAHMPYAESNHAGQLFGLRREQGTLETLPAEVRGAIGDRPRLPVWRAGMVLAHLDAGDHARARADYEALAASGFEAIPADVFWLGSMCLLTEACSRLADAARAADLSARLAPYAARNAQIGLAVSVGPVHRHLGLLAALQHDWAVAERHFEAAIARSDELGAVPSLAHTRCDFADLLLARGGPGDRDRAAEHVVRAERVATELRIPRLAQRAAELARALAA